MLFFCLPMKGLSSESLRLPCSKGKMGCNFLTAFHIIVINSKNDKANMLILLFSAYRNEFPSQDVRKFSLLVHLCSTLCFSVQLCKGAEDIFKSAGELVPATDDPTDFFI